jgi:hypothetical protein
MKSELLKVSVLVYRANVSRDNRSMILAEAWEHIEALRLLFRLAHDTKTISLGSFVELAESIEAISKQLAAWQYTCPDAYLLRPLSEGLLIRSF